MSNLYKQSLINNHLNNHNPIGVILVSDQRKLQQIKRQSSDYGFDYIVCFYDGVYFIFYFNCADFYTLEFHVQSFGPRGVSFLFIPHDSSVGAHW